MTPAADHALDGLAPRRVLAPADRHQLAHELGAARARGEAVLPRGLGTRGGQGAPPRSLDLVLLTTGLDRLVQHEPGDLTVTVEAGVPLADLAARLARHGQWLPARGAHPRRPGPGSVGGLLATAPSGTHTLSRGRLRDRVLGSLVALPDGTLAQGRGRVVKNVAGFDLPRLFTGSFGTLGVWVEVTLRLEPLPAASATLRAACADASAAEQAERRLRDGPDEPAFVSLQVDGDGPWRLLAGFDGSRARVDGALERSRRALGGLGCDDVAVFEGEGEDSLRAALDDPPRALVEALAADAPDARSAVLRLGAPPPALGAAVHAARAAAATRGHAHRVDLRPGTGEAWLAVAPDAGDEHAAVADLDALLLAARAHAATVLRAAPAAWRARLDVWGPPPAEMFLMERVKRACDPEGTLVAGRFVGGL